MNYGLPTYIEIENTKYNIRNKGDYRMVLDVIEALNDPNLNDKEKTLCVLRIFYEDFESMQESHIEKAIKEAFAFIDGEYEYSSKPAKEKKPVMDWQQDFKWIVSPVNSVLGTEIRSLPYLHWWTFLGAYYEIGDCFLHKLFQLEVKRIKERN